MTIKRILHASDFSRASQPAFRLARQLARTLKAELIVFNAADSVTPVLGEGYVSPTVVREVWQAGRRMAQRGVDALARQARADSIRARGAVGEGPAAPAIIAAANRYRAQLIVVGTHGRSGVRRLLIGSVAERVVRTAACPVLTVGS
jgi:nucleotide-binding universal stress UspA family protein